MEQWREASDEMHATRGVATRSAANPANAPTIGGADVTNVSLLRLLSKRRKTSGKGNHYDRMEDELWDAPHEQTSFTKRCIDNQGDHVQNGEMERCYKNGKWKLPANT